MKFALALLFLPIMSLAQEAKYNHPTLLGPRFNLLQFKTNKPFSKGRQMDAGVGMVFLKGFSPRVDWQLSVDGSFTDSASNQKLTSKSLLAQSDIALRLRMFRPDQKFQPYVSLGTGIQSYSKEVGIYFPMGIGFQWNLFKEIYLLSQAQCRLTIPNNINRHLLFSIGFAGKLTGGKRKTQGVPETIATLALTVPPVDTDKDGIADSADLCPQAAGMAIYNGCPDTDKDGIPDKEDACPTIVGIETLHGCPVPDSDGYGLVDSIDNCVNNAGPIHNLGCPIDTPETSKRLALAAMFIQFETSSANLNKDSYRYLDTVVQILVENPGIHLLIEGHTDNTSTIRYNTVLSQDRAKTVFDHLIAKGIEPSRLKHLGWGPSRPVSDNRTKEGRAKNRRVELTISAVTKT